MAAKPLTPSALRACTTALPQAWNLLPAKRFLAPADCFFETTFPLLFLTNLSFVRPPLVFSFEPRNTASLASLPFAILLAFIGFIAFIAFFAFIAFMAFMAFMAFIAFIA